MLTRELGLRVTLFKPTPLTSVLVIYLGVVGTALIEAERVQHAGGIDRVTCSEAAKSLYVASLCRFSPISTSILFADVSPNKVSGPPGIPTNPQRRHAQGPEITSASCAALSRVFDVSSTAV